jgi:rod shape-determining protein MreC
VGPGKWRWAVLGPIILIIAGIIVATTGPRDELGWAEKAFREALAPLQSGVTRIADGIVGVTTRIVRLTRLAKENEALRKEVEELRTERAALLEAQRENEELRRLVDLERRAPDQVQIAEVIYRTPGNWFSTIIINKGSAHNVEKGMAVVTPEGVVGHVRLVTRHTAEVMLITDTKSALCGRVYRTNQVVLVEGQGDAGRGKALVKPLASEADLVVGDYIITSGLSEIYPKGLPVGIVEAVYEGRYGLTTYGQLQPFVEFDRLEWVAVLTKPHARFGEEVYGGHP